MLESTPEALVSELRNDLGSDLRLVARYGPDDFDLLYVREDVANVRTDDDYEVLHANTLAAHDDRPEIEDAMGAGPLRARLLSFEEIFGANFFGEEQHGHVITIESDAEIDLRRYLRKFGIITTTVRRFESIRFEHQPAGRSCPRCASAATISTPEAGPGSPYYCLTYDTGF